MKQRSIRTAVITGPTGAVGTALCERLLDAGVTVFAIIRPGSTRADALPKHEKLYLVECDASELAELPERIEGIQADVFYHLAWAQTTGLGRNDMPVQIDNIRYTVEAVRAAKKIGCHVFVGVGSQAEYGRVEGLLRSDTPPFPENGYGMAKLCAGQMSRVECQALDIEHIWVRILSVYGPRDGMGSMISGTIRKLLTGERPALTAGIQKWDYLYSSDAAQALYLCALYGRDGAVYPLGSGQARTLRDYIEEMRDAIDPSLPLGLGEVPYGPMQVMHLQADITELSRDTGFEPVMSFTEGIRKTIKWMKDEQHA